jgi:hypothetical protein
MVPYGDGLAMGTSWKGGESLLEEEKFGMLSKEQREEFGAVHRLEAPGSLCAVIEWKEEPSKFRFVVEDRRMSIFQDGKELASTEIGSPLRVDSSDPILNFENGVFGPFGGKSISKIPD